MRFRVTKQHDDKRASVGANMAEIARVTRHESEAMLRRYIRAGTMFERDPLRGGLIR